MANLFGKSRRAIGLLSLSLVAAGLNVQLCVQADEQKVAASQSPSNPGLAGDSNAVSMQYNLVDMHGTVDKVARTAKDFVHECERKQIRLTDPPELMDWNVMPMMMDSIQGDAQGPGACLPPRSEHIDLYVSELKQLMPILEKDLLAIPDSSVADVQVEITEMRSVVKRMDDSGSLLVDLCGGPKYQNILIDKQARRLHDDAEGLDKIIKRLMQKLKAA